MPCGTARDDAFYQAPAVKPGDTVAETVYSYRAQLTTALAAFLPTLNQEQLTKLSESARNGDLLRGRYRAVIEGKQYGDPLQIALMGDRDASMDADTRRRFVEMTRTWDGATLDADRGPLVPVKVSSMHEASLMLLRAIDQELAGRLAGLLIDAQQREYEAMQAERNAPQLTFSEYQNVSSYDTQMAAEVRDGRRY